LTFNFKPIIGDFGLNPAGVSMFLDNGDASVILNLEYFIKKLEDKLPVDTPIEPLPEENPDSNPNTGTIGGTTTTKPIETPTPITWARTFTF